MSKKVLDFVLEQIEDYQDSNELDEAIKNSSGIYHDFDEALKILGIDENEI